jgi:hypothetical protein
MRRSDTALPHGNLFEPESPPETPRSSRKKTPSLRIRKLGRELRAREWDGDATTSETAELQRRFVAVRGIKKWWKAVKQFVCVNQTEQNGTEGFIRRAGKNVVCAITQDAIPTEHAFKFVTPTGQVIAYSARDIITYLKDSGIFRCPCTTVPFTISVVRRLERRGARAGFCDPNELVAIYVRRHVIVQSEIEQRNRALAMESACGVVLSEAVNLCNDPNVSASEAFNEIHLFIMPEYRSFVLDYYVFNHQSCVAMLLADREKLRRLERTTNTDSHGILFVVMDTVQELIDRFDRLGRSNRLRATTSSSSSSTSSSGRQQPDSSRQPILATPVAQQVSYLPVPHFYLQRPSAFINRVQNLPDETGFFTALNFASGNRNRNPSPTNDQRTAQRVRDVLPLSEGFDDETFISDLVASITSNSRSVGNRRGAQEE